MRVLKWILPVAIMLVFLFLIQTNEVQKANAVNLKDAANHQAVKVTAENKDNLKPVIAVKELTDKNVIELTSKFMDLLVQESDNYYKVINFDTKDELIKAFDQVSSRNVTKKYIDFYYREKSDGLYIIPTETPAWLNENSDFNVIQLDHNQAKVVQHNKSDLHGIYTVEFYFTYDNGWKITNVVHS